VWVKLDDGFADHPKVVGRSDAALASWLKALCYCGRYRTDGHVPEAMTRRIAKPRVRLELVSAGLWDEAPLGGVLVHDYLQWNPSRAEIERKAEQNKARVQRHRDDAS
jgi:hypothetical protein